MRLFLFTLSLLVLACNNSTTVENTKTTPDDFDWQGHRGARGILPENSIPGFLLALEYPIKTLELDLAISQDEQVIVSHEPWMSAEICKKPDGTPVAESEQEAIRIFELTYEQIKGYDCGSLGNSRFAQQQPMTTYKPSLRDMVQAVENLVVEKERTPPMYNMEIKSRPSWDSLYTPVPAKFAQLVLATIADLGIEERTVIQSFDVRALQAVHEQNPAIKTALLIDNTDSFAENLEKLGFTPTIYSPYHELVTEALIQQAHEEKVRVIPWTVNTVGHMQDLIAIGVDGIITDYPNLIEEVE